MRGNNRSSQYYNPYHGSGNGSGGGGGGGGVGGGLLGSAFSPRKVEGRRRLLAGSPSTSPVPSRPFAQLDLRSSDLDRVEREQRVGGGSLGTSLVDGGDPYESFGNHSIASSYAGDRDRPRILDKVSRPRGRIAKIFASRAAIGGDRHATSYDHYGTTTTCTTDFRSLSPRKRREWERIRDYERHENDAVVVSPSTVRYGRCNDNNDDYGDDDDGGNPTEHWPGTQDGMGRTISMPDDDDDDEDEEMEQNVENDHPWGTANLSMNPSNLSSSTPSKYQVYSSSSDLSSRRTTPLHQRTNSHHDQYHDAVDSINSNSNRRTGTGTGTGTTTTPTTSSGYTLKPLPPPRDTVRKKAAAAARRRQEDSELRPRQSPTQEVEKVFIDVIKGHRSPTSPTSTASSTSPAPTSSRDKAGNGSSNADLYQPKGKTINLLNLFNNTASTLTSTTTSSLNYSLDHHHHPNRSIVTTSASRDSSRQRRQRKDRREDRRSASAPRAGLVIESTRKHRDRIFPLEPAAPPETNDDPMMDSPSKSTPIIDVTASAGRVRSSGRVVRLSEEALANLCSPPAHHLMLRSGSSGYRGYIDKTKDMPNLMDDVETEVDDTTTTAADEPSYNRNSNTRLVDLSEDSDVFAGVASPRTTTQRHIMEKDDNNHNTSSTTLNDSQSDIFSGLSSVAPSSHLSHHSSHASRFHRQEKKQAQSQKSKRQPQTTQTPAPSPPEKESSPKSSKSRQRQRPRSTPHNRPLNKTKDRRSVTPLSSSFHSGMNDSMNTSMTINTTATSIVTSSTLSTTSSGHRRDKNKKKTSSNSTKKKRRSRTSPRSPSPSSRMELESPSHTHTVTSSMEKNKNINPDLSIYYIQPSVVERLVRRFRRCCRKDPSEINNTETAGDAKKAFALLEMRSRVMETDMERGLERRGGVGSHVDDLALTEYHKAAFRVRDVVVVSKAWRDGASPADVKVAHRLTRPPHLVYHCLVRWTDDTDFALLRCISLGPRCMRGFEMFTVGDCQSLLLKLTNERCTQLRNELNEATARQIDAEDVLNNSRKNKITTNLSATKEAYRTAVAEVKATSKKLVLAEKSFQLVRKRIERLITEYQTLLVNMEENGNKGGADDDRSASSHHHTKLNGKDITKEDEEVTYESDPYGDDEDDPCHREETQKLARRAQRAELRAEVAAREVAVAKEEAERLRRVKQEELEELRQRLQELEERSAIEATQRLPHDPQALLKTASSVVSDRSKQRDADSRAAKERVKAKFRDRRARGGLTPSTSARASPEPRTPSNDHPPPSKPTRQAIADRFNGDEMLQHVQFYERSLRNIGVDG